MRDRMEYGDRRNARHGRDQPREGSRPRQRSSSPTRRQRSKSPTQDRWTRDRHRDRSDRGRDHDTTDERRVRRKHTSRGQFPERPSGRDVQDDPSIHASNYTEYRRLKRQRMAELNEWLIWGRSPSPIHEPLLDKDEKPASEQRIEEDAQPKEIDPAEAELDKEELRLFIKWLENYKSEILEQEERRRKAEEESRPVGPAPPPQARVDDPSSYGINLRPGEGERMAEFARQGQRIPRRGEVGLTSEQIESFEDIGYVMSGSRHSRMNAIRIRKENQVYTAEEKAALAMFNQEEAKRKEQQLTDQFKQLIRETIGEAGGEAGTSGGRDTAGDEAPGT